MLINGVLDYFPVSTSGFLYAGALTTGNPTNNRIFNSFYRGTLSDNSPVAIPTASNPYYSDLDGILRPAEGGFATGTYALDTNLPYGVLGVDGSTASISDQQIKFRRESELHALSKVGTARTWTLMIDVIAQVGRYPAGAGGLSQFLVEGEVRCWLHISIDRYTGQILDRSLEPVYE